jgi:hypothetical protein
MSQYRVVAERQTIMVNLRRLGGPLQIFFLCGNSHFIFMNLRCGAMRLRFIYALGTIMSS